MPDHAPIDGPALGPGHGHIIVCGMGDVGYRVVELLQRMGESVVVVTEQAHDDRRRAVLLCSLVGGAEVRERADELERFVDARCPDRCTFRRDLLTLDDIRG